VLIDAHSHILSLAADPEFTAAYGREGSLCIFRSMGVLPSHRMPTEDEWEASGFSGRGWPLIGPAESLRDHPGFDKVVVLAVSPQYLDGRLIGRIQTFVPPGRPRPPGTFDVGIGLREHARGQGYGREALDLFTGWLFGHAAAEVVEGSTDPANAAMRAVFQRAGWTFAGPVTEVGREWDQYRITRDDWASCTAHRRW